MGSAGVLNSCRQFSWVPLSPRPRAQLEFYPIVPQGSGNTLPAITSGAFLPRACSLGHTLPYLARNGAGTFLHKSCRGKHEYCWRHGARGVRTAVCVRDGRFHDPRLIAPATWGFRNLRECTRNFGCCFNHTSYVTNGSSESVKTASSLVRELAASVVGFCWATTRFIDR
jgi:hypothetical protein